MVQDEEIKTNDVGTSAELGSNISEIDTADTTQEWRDAVVLGTATESEEVRFWRIDNDIVVCSPLSQCTDKIWSLIV